MLPASRPLPGTLPLDPASPARGLHLAPPPTRPHPLLHLRRARPPQRWHAASGEPCVEFAPAPQPAAGSGAGEGDKPEARSVHRGATEEALLFPDRHVPHWTPALALYFPAGCVLAASRMLLWVALILLDQPWLTDNDTSIKGLLFLLGVDVRWEHKERIPQGSHIVVSNHVTTGDFMVLYGLGRPYTHLVSASLPSRVTQAQHHRVRMQPATPTTCSRLAAEQGSTEEAIHVFPEGGMTSGAGMLTFSRGFARVAGERSVSPVALRADIPWGIHAHTLTSSFLANFFWAFFPPKTLLTATALPAMRLAEGESKARFVQRVQRAIAEELGVPICSLDMNAKRKLIAKRRAERV